MDNTQNIISFCTGYGGIELGLRGAGVDVRVICNVEIEAFVQANLVAKIEEGRMDDAPIFSDLKTFPAEIFRGKIHGITCGYPCQPFSSVGKRKGENDPRHLWPRIREHARAIGVQWIFAENVEGHISLGLSTVISDLEEDGYKTAWGIFSAEEVGAPHQRKRVYILAHTTSWKSRKSQARHGGESIGGGSEEVRWPSRPGESQHEWEPPRTTITRLGGMSNGTTYRNQRLMLLGNGVVPQTAEIAWKTLWRKINENND